MATETVNALAKQVINGSITLADVRNTHGEETAVKVYDATISQPWRNWSAQWTRRVR